MFINEETYMNHRTILAVLFACVLAFAGTAVEAAPPAHAQAHGHMSKAVEKASSESGKVDVIVQFEKGRRADAEAAIANGNGQVTKDFDNLPMVVVSIPAHALDNMSRARGVQFVSLDSAVSGFSKAGRMTANVPPLGSVYDAIYNGGGYRVAVVDSGVGNHPDIPFVSQVDFVGRLKYASDPYGHGTHIAGMISGFGTASGFVHWGLAWNAPIVSLRVLDGNGQGTVSSVLAAIDWLLSYHATHNIKVANFSLGKAVEESDAGEHAGP